MTDPSVEQFGQMGFELSYTQPEAEPGIPLLENSRTFTHGLPQQTQPGL
jgi:hypothetical protein